MYNKNFIVLILSIFLLASCETATKKTVTGDASKTSGSSSAKHSKHSPKSDSESDSEPDSEPHLSLL